MTDIERGFMAFINVNHDDLFYTCSRTQGQRNLLLIHGSGADHSSWPDALLQTAEASVYAFDLPGHGRSKGKGRDRVEDYADVVQGLVLQLGLENVCLAGHSLGGAVVQNLGLRAPEWLSGLILVGTGCRLRVAPAILEGLAKDFEKTVDLVCDWAYGPEAAPELIRAGKKVFLQGDPQVMHGDFMACNRFDLCGRISEIALPTLILSGSEDRLTPVKYGHFLRDRIPGSRLVEIQGAGHMMALERPGEFTRAVLEFLVPYA